MIRLPSVTVGASRRVALWRIGLGAAGALLVVVALVGPRETSVVAAPASLARALAADMVAVRVPYSWLAAAPPRLGLGDQVDVVGTRVADRSTSIASLVSAARVLEVDQDAVVIELPPDDAAALAIARANSYVLLLLLRPRP